MAESKMPAKIWAGQGKSCFRFWQKRKPHAFDNSVCNTLYHRADLVDPLVEALRGMLSWAEARPDKHPLDTWNAGRDALQAYEAAQ